METIIYFIRHAQSHPTSKSVPSEWPLSELGRKQAHSLPNLIRELNIEKVFSSPFRRCKDTILPFTERFNVPIDFHEGLREQGPTYTLDKLLDDGYKLDDFYKIWEKSWEDFHFSIPGYESSYQAQIRFLRAVKEISNKHCGKILGISTHGQVLGLFLNLIHPNFNFKETLALRNPDVLKVVSRDNIFEWDQGFSLSELDKLSTHYTLTPIEL